MNRNGNLAVDYENINSMGEHYRREEKSERRIQVHRGLGGKRKGKAMGAFLGVVIVVLLAVALFGRVEISELYTQRAELESKLEHVQEENVSLEAEFTQKTGMTKVEEYAEDKLGLHKLDKSQIEYVEVDSPEKAEVINTEDTNVFVKIKRWFNSALEYIGL